MYLREVSENDQGPSNRYYRPYLGVKRIAGMSKAIKKRPLNAKGKYYVDQDVCTFSGNCVLVALNNFKMDKENFVYVSKQPSTPEEEAQCRRAMNECPVAAIYDDDDS